ncbi:MAG: EF-P beta-lysylation protein EpmB [Legionellales bacterium]|nr:EF-P beta-lysylation protein EpmB [Legionellales bacterium]
MIQHETDWRIDLKTAVTDHTTLLTHLKLPTHQSVMPTPFPLRVPWPFIHRMKPQDPQDPLLLQVLPQETEHIHAPGYSLDPLQELNKNPVTGIIHKYQGRALLLLAGGCAINCRYCFRRHFNYTANTTPFKKQDTTYQYLQNDRSIQEVILSGGDPLLYDDGPLDRVIQTLESLSHLKRLRIHTRLPIVIPNRITSTFVQRLAQSHLKVTLVVHCNHPQELDITTAEAFDRLRQKGIYVLNQSVLLKGINDDSSTLIELSETLFEQGVLPYYLHQLDPVMGSAHFEVPHDQIKQIEHDLLCALPGYLVPKIVSDQPNTLHKTHWRA